jgi:hypothetical protein
MLVASSAQAPSSYHEILIAAKGHSSMSPTARVEYATRTGKAVNPYCPSACPILHQIYRELGDEKFTSRLSPAKLQIVRVPKEISLQDLQISFDFNENHEFVEEKHRLWLPESEQLKLEQETEEEAGPAKKSKKGKKRATDPPMRKIVVNRFPGKGFLLSDQAVALYARLSKMDPVADAERIRAKAVLQRDDPLLVAVVEKLGTAASATFSFIKIVKIPVDVKDWVIEQQEGLEHVAEKHLKWMPVLPQAGAAAQ